MLSNMNKSVRSIAPMILLLLICKVSAAQSLNFTQYALPPGSSPQAIAAGPDGALWFTCWYGSAIGRITVDGAISLYPVASFNSELWGITGGPDGALWFTGDIHNQIGRIGTNGVITLYDVPTSNATPAQIVLGPDGALWFTEFFGQKIGRISPNGTITEYPVPTFQAQPFGITAGPDGALWFTETNGNKIGRITTAGVITEYIIPFTARPNFITVGPDGALWFTDRDGNKIGRITTMGAITQFAVPTANAGLQGITAGPDGAVWFAEYYAAKIGRISSAGVVTEYLVPTPSASPNRIIGGPDGALWFTEFSGDQIGRAVITSSTLQLFAITPNPLVGFSGNQILHLYGTNFQPGAKVLLSTGGNTFTLSGAQIVALSSTDMQVLATVGATPASWTAQVVNPDNTTSGLLPFTVVAPGLPNITGISPNPVPGANYDQILTITGSGFQPGLTVPLRTGGNTFTLSGTQIVSVTPTQIQVLATVSTNAASWTAQVVNAGGASSTQFPFTVAAAGGPQITAINPNPVPGLSADQQITIYGSNFRAGLSVRLRNGTGCCPDLTGAQIPVLTATRLVILANVGAASGNWTAQIANADGTVSNIANFAVGTGGPLITSNLSVGSQPDTFVTTGTGFTPSVSVPVWVRKPDLSEAAIGVVTSTASGAISHSYNSGPPNLAGIFSFWAVDPVKGKSNEITRTINPPPTPAGTVLCQKSHCSQDPINTATGAYIYTRTDLTVPGAGLPFSFVRFYNSQTGVAGPMGFGWSHSYMATLTVNPIDNSVSVRMGDGRLLAFNYVNGAYIPVVEGSFEQLVLTSQSTFSLTLKDQTVFNFQYGRLTRIADKNSNVITFGYTDGNLTNITDSALRSYVLNYTAGNQLATLTDPAGRVLRYSYDSAGNLTGFDDPRGKHFTYAYDGGHHILTATDPEGNVFLSNAYDGSGRVISQADGAGNTWGYAYNTSNPSLIVTTITDPNGKTALDNHDIRFRLLQQTDTTGKTASFAYDDSDNRTQVTDRNNNATRYAYDPAGNVTGITDPMNKVTSFVYDGKNNPTSRVDALNNLTSFGYDAKGNLTTVTDASLKTTTTTYTANGLPLTVMDALGRVTTNTYDASGNLTQVLDAGGNTTSYAYDTIGRRLSMTDARGFTTAYQYDAADNLIQVTDPLGNTVQYVYDGNNNRIRMTDQRGKLTKYTYDGNYKLKVTTDPLGGTITNTYDNLRNLATTTDQRGNVTSYTYDSENRLIQTTVAGTIVTKYTYDANGNRLTVTDPLNKTSTTVYDVLNRPVSVTDALNQTVSTQYDALGRVTQRTDAAGNVTQSFYDALGRLIKTQDALGGQVLFGYDAVGNRIQITDARGKITGFTYDALNRVATITDPLGNVTTNTYDAVGNLASVKDANGNTKAYQYDANRRQTQVAYSTGGSIQWVYDAAGNRTRMTDLQGVSNYTFDELNRLVTYQPPLGPTVGFGYDAAGNRTSIQYGAGKTVTYTYDPVNRLATVKDWNNALTAYSYDADSRPLVVTLPNGLTTGYTYDAVGQLTSLQHKQGATAVYAETTTWSVNGNPLSSDITGLSGASIAPEQTTYAYNDASQLTGTSAGAFVSDKNGNVLSQPGPTTFAYDINNRPTQIAGGANAVMKYFGDGKLAEFDDAGAVRRILQDPGATGNRVLAELDAAGAIQRAYVHGLGMVSVIDGAATYYYLHNLQGSTVAVANSAGAIQASYRYDPFGRVIQSGGTLTYPFKFLGRYSVPSVGDFSVTTFRAYDSRSGRFTGVDRAIFNTDDVGSSYLYARQSPLRLIDPSGLSAENAISTAISILDPKSLPKVKREGWFDRTFYGISWAKCRQGLKSCVPRYGNNGGPDYPGNFSLTAPAKQQPIPIDSQDVLYVRHDTMYAIADMSDPITAAVITLEADIDLEVGLSQLKVSRGSAYQLAAQTAFGYKIVYWDLVAAPASVAATEAWQGARTVANASSRWLHSTWSSIWP